MNSTRLKEMLIKTVPCLKEHAEGRNVLLMFEKDVEEGIRSACNQNVSQML